MSEFHVIEVEFEDKECLIKSLEEMGYKPKVHNEATNLYGYQGDKRKQKAHIILPRSQVGSSSNDIGFEKREDGKYTMHISQFDKSFWGKNVNVLKKTYAKNRINKFISQNAGSYSLASRTEKKNGAISIRLRRLK